MKHILIALAVVLSTVSSAQTKRPDDSVREADWKISCASHSYVVNFLKEYDERPVITGNIGRKGKIAFLINTKTGTWTLLAYTDQGACIMAAGDDAELLESLRRE
jgi:hypothetical protein